MKKQLFLTLKSYSFRHAASVSAAIFIVFLMNHYFSYSEQGWLILTAFFICQATRGTPLRQALVIFTIIVVAVLSADFIRMLTGQPFILFFISIFIFIVSSYLIGSRRLISNQTAFMGLLFSIVLLIAAFLPAKSISLVRGQLIDITIGAFIGMMCTQLIFPVRFDQEFRQGVIPILKILIQYSQALTHSFLKKETEGDLKKYRTLIEETLQSQSGLYPEWIYETGFNPGLRSGFRFFLVTLERLTELFFSMDYYMRKSAGIAKSLHHADQLISSIQKTMMTNEELLTILMTYFMTNKINKPTSNYTEDISTLEIVVHQIVPHHLELLDISADNLTLITLVKDIKAMREMLLQLVMSLPN